VDILKRREENHDLQNHVEKGEKGGRRGGLKRPNRGKRLVQMREPVSTITGSIDRSKIRVPRKGGESKIRAGEGPPKKEPKKLKDESLGPVLPKRQSE